MKSADNWGINAEHLKVKLYARILGVTADLEPPAKDPEITTKYQFLLPICIGTGRLRLRTWKLIRSNDPVLRWEDILWSKNMIFPRHEVAKQTRAEIGANTLRLSGPRQGSYSSVDPATADYVYPGSVSYQKYDCPADYYNVASRAEKVFFTMSSGDTVLRGWFNTPTYAMLAVLSDRYSLEGPMISVALGSMTTCRRIHRRRPCMK